MVDEKGNHDKRSDDAGNRMLKRACERLGGGEEGGANNRVMTMKEGRKN